MTESTEAVYYQKEQSHTLLPCCHGGCCCGSLGCYRDHDHARALNELLQEGIQLRQQLERQRQQLEQQWQQLEQQRIQMNRQGLQITQLQIVVSMAHHEVKTGEIETAEQRLRDYCDDCDD